MRCLTNSECLAWLADEGFAGADRLPVAPGGYEICFQIPAEARAQRMLARDLAVWLAPEGATLLWLKDWRFPKPEELTLIAGLRRGHGERRALEAASGHLFEMPEQDELAAWIGLAMSFSWDGGCYALPWRQDRLEVTHEELVGLATASAERFAAARRLARRYEADIYRETEAP